MIIYDIEIKKGIVGKGGVKQPNIEYCGGWQDHANMGISCICAYDYKEDRFRTFMDDNYATFQELVDKSNVVVGFNSNSFDNAVCAANSLVIPPEKSYDILVEIWAGVGLGPKFSYPSHIGYGLDAVCEANFGANKSGNGALAPVWFQQGKFGGLIDYCLQDVALTKKLLDKIIKDGSIISPKSLSLITIRKPTEAV